MKIEWTSKALSDVARFVESTSDRQSGARLARSLTKAPRILVQYPQLGERLDRFNPRDVRRILMDGYEIRYELLHSKIVILRVKHTRESWD